MNKRKYLTLFLILLLGVSIIFTLASCSTLGGNNNDNNDDMHGHDEDKNPPCEHMWTDWEIVEEATCIKEGSKIRFCEKCGQEERAIIPKGEHTYVKKNDVNNSWDECSVCGDKKNIKAHEYIAGTNKCANCDYCMNDLFTFEPSWNEGYNITAVDLSAHPEIETLYLPATHDGKKVYEIAQDALTQCDKIKSIVFSANSILYYGLDLSKCTALENISVDGGNEHLRAENNCVLRGEELLVALDVASIPDSVTWIQQGAFLNNTSIVDLVLPSQITSIGNSAFKGCINMKSVTIPSTTECTISYEAFLGCTNIEEINLGVGVELNSGVFDPNIETMPRATVPAHWWADNYNDAFIEKVVDLTIKDGGVIPQAKREHTGSKIEKLTIKGDITDIEYFAFHRMPALKSLTIDAMTNTGNHSFSECKALESLDIVKAKEISKYSFDECTALRTVNLGQNVENIREGAFTMCSSIKDITLPHSLQDIEVDAFRDCIGLTSMTIPSSIRVLNDIMKGCENIENVTLEEGIEELGHRALAVTHAKHIDLPSTIKMIGPDAFSCADIEDITLPSGLESIGERAFYGARLRDNIVIPINVKEIGPDAFSHLNNGFICKAEATARPNGWASNWFGNYEGKTVWDCNNNDVSANGKVYYQDGVATYELSKDEQYGNEVVDMAKIHFIHKDVAKYTTLPSITHKGKIYPVLYVDAWVFNDCTELEEITIAEGVTSISYGAFTNCEKLKAIHLPSTLDNISGSYRLNSLSTITVAPGNKDISVVDNCLIKINTDSEKELVMAPSNLARVPDGVVKIGESAFGGNTVLKNIVLPSSVKEVDMYAFGDCTSLESITLNEGLLTISTSAFTSCTALRSITIPNSVDSVYQDAFSYCTSLEKVNWNKNTGKINNGMFKGCTSLNSVVIPEGVTSIGTAAFSGCTSLTTITLPASMQSIGISAFKDCTALTTINMPVGMKSIDDSAFSGCTALTSVTMPYSTMESIGANAFENCTGLESIVIPCFVTKIGADAFKGCTNITINVEAATAAPDWDSNWNRDNLPVKMGYNNITTNADYDYIIHDDKVIATRYKGTATSVRVSGRPEDLIDGKEISHFGFAFRNTDIREIIIYLSVDNCSVDAFRGCNVDIFLAAKVDYAIQDWPKGWNSGNRVYLYSDTYQSASSAPEGFAGYWYETQDGKAIKW